jgi:hypothetical protein
MLKIEEGKYYKTRDGRKVGPIRKRSDVDYPWIIDGVSTYKDDGSDCRYEDCVYHLIAEWTDGPVVTETVTKTRIVPGVYGPAVEVNEWHEDTRKVVLTFHGRVYDADQLDAAAAVLSALAKGLRDA